MHRSQPHSENAAQPLHLRWAVPLFSGTLLVSAFLLFWIQLLVGKLLLPLFGGSPSVWNTCLVFFQTLLLAGYAYAHIITTRLAVRRQALLQLGLLALGLSMLPIRIPHAWAPPPDASPILSLLGLLCRVIGLPFFILSATAPLLQRWFATTDHPTAKDPYFLYAASNVGSFAALLSYPFWVEPHLGLAEQRVQWTLGYAGLLALTCCCAALVRRPAADVPQRSTLEDADRDVTWNRRVRWLFLALAPCSLMLGVTMYLSTDIAAVPIVWVIPLTLYLLTFVLVFAKRPLLPHTLMVRALPVVILPLAILMVANHTRPWPVMMGLHLLAFFVAAMVCHGELAKARPPTRYLTEFYLWMALGGALGGWFNALAAPLVFDSVLEYPLAMALACLLRPGSEDADRRPGVVRLDYLFPITLGFFVASLALAGRPIGLQSRPLYVALLCGPPALICAFFRRRSVRFGLGIGAFLLVGLFGTVDWEHVLHAERSFFGVYRVRAVGQSGAYHELTHGTTLHGIQHLRSARRREPLTYYHPSGPLGDVFGFFVGDTPRLNQVAAIGLGTGSVACYASPGQRWTFYEIDPAVARIATDPRLFTYLQDCLEQVTFVMGDARLSLARAPPETYDLILVDAFTSDAIPIHLMTREAVQLYLSKLHRGGLLAFHISNRYLKLHPVLANLAGELGLLCAGRSGSITSKERALGISPSTWVVLARPGTDLGALVRKRTWRPLPGRGNGVRWTDDFSNILSVLRWR